MLFKKNLPLFFRHFSSKMRGLNWSLPAEICDAFSNVLHFIDVLHFWYIFIFFKVKLYLKLWLEILWVKFNRLNLVSEKLWKFYFFLPYSLLHLEIQGTFGTTKEKKLITVLLIILGLIWQVNYSNIFLIRCSFRLGVLMDECPNDISCFFSIFWQ